MPAMKYRGPYRVRAKYNKPEPEILHMRDATVKVLYSYICESDFHLITAWFQVCASVL